VSRATTTRTGSLDTGRVVGWARDQGVYVAFALLMLFNAVFTTNFATTATLLNLLVQVSPVVIVSLGMALVIGTEGIDLSVGAVMAIAAAIIPLYLGYGWPVAVLIALVVGALAGALNGSLVAFVGMQPIIATLALFVGGRGLAQVLVGGQLQIIRDPSFIALGRAEVFGVPIPVIVAAVLAIVVGFVVRRTTFGRYVLSIGGNRAASYLSGHPVRGVLVAVYAISAVLATIAGVLATARLSAGDPSTVGILIELDAIAAVVIGGTPLSGGKVSIAGTVMGALVMQLITATFIMNDLPFTYAQMLKAVIILLAVYIQRGRGSA
jgi:ribose/xylose/arabinose/galactoside ABC-type transport system permease subunit